MLMKSQAQGRSVGPDGIERRQCGICRWIEGNKGDCEYFRRLGDCSTRVTQWVPQDQWNKHTTLLLLFIWVARLLVGFARSPACYIIALVRPSLARFCVLCVGCVCERALKVYLRPRVQHRKVHRSLFPCSTRSGPRWFRFWPAWRKIGKSVARRGDDTKWGGKTSWPCVRAAANRSLAWAAPRAHTKEMRYKWDR